MNANDIAFFLDAVEKTIKHIENLQDCITELQSAGTGLTVEDNKALDEHWVQLQLAWEKSQSRKTELLAMQASL